MNNPSTASAPPGDQTSPTLLAEPLGFAQVRALMALGKFKQAVFSGKEIHKRENSPASELLLVEAYLGRISQLQANGAADDARTVLKLVYDRFPGHRHRLALLTARAAAAQGNLKELLSPLASPDLPAERREVIESAIRQDLIDLPALAASPVLPADHPLRVAAGAVWRAFEAVTAAPVDEGVIALAEVARRSPLAGWKMLVRAISAYYRNDDDACRRAIEQIPPDAAARRLGTVLLSAVERTSAAAGAAAVLVSRIGQDKSLSEALDDFEQAVQTSSSHILNKAMRAAVSACATHRPELLERLRQHIFARCIMEEFPQSQIVKATGRPLVNAYFWRLLASGMEMDGSHPWAALYWERFLVHGVHEGKFTADGPEAAAIYFRAATALLNEDEEDLEDLRGGFDDDDEAPLEVTYEGQPADIAALKPGNFVELAKRVWSPAWLFAKCVELDPAAGVFKKWLGWAHKSEIPAKDVQAILESWQRKLPTDVQPLLELSNLAESRGSLKLALKHLSAAEAIDATSPYVRKARLRLTLGITWGHFKDHKPNLVEKDLAELAAMPAMTEGDRPAFLLALRATFHALRGDESAARETFADLEQRVGPVLAEAIMSSVRTTARPKLLAVWPVGPPPILPDPHAVADAVARLSVLWKEMRIDIALPPNWAAITGDVLGERPSRLSPANLLAIGRLAVQQSQGRMAYLASSALLETGSGPGASARALLLRARSLPKWADQRIWQCLRAASEYSRQANDTDLIAEVAGEIGQYPRAHRSNAARPLGDDLLAEVLKREREASAFPANVNDADEYVVAIDVGPRRPSFDDFNPFGNEDDEDDEEDDGDEEDDFGDEEDEDDEFDASGPVPGFPRSIRANLEPIIRKIIEKYGRVGTPDELFRKDPALAVELIMALQGMNFNQKMLNDVAKQLKNLMPPDSDGKRKRRK